MKLDVMRAWGLFLLATALVLIALWLDSNDDQGAI